MIKKYRKYKDFICQDASVNKMTNPIIQFLSCNDNFGPHRVLRLLRKVEYFQFRKSFISKILGLYYLLAFRRARAKHNIMIFPGCFGPGLHLEHPGFRRLGRFVSCGSNCTILPMVLIGRKTPIGPEPTVRIGNECYISTGVTILGPVTIGNNVTIGAGAVVTKDIPDNAVVGGVPAKIIRFKS